VRLGEYFKTAFLGRWNLLALFGATGFAALSGYPEVFLPLVAAGEILYVGMLGAHPKFQRAVDARAAAASRGDGRQASNRALEQILAALPRPALARYERLQSRCLELRKIASDLKRTRADGMDLPLDSFQLEGLDKLLWIFVRLLFTHHSLGQFLQRADSARMEDEILKVEARLNGLSGQADSPHLLKMQRTLEDHLKTSKGRLDNYKKAEANQELVSLEIDRLENKINTLAELAVNRQEPDFIAGQVDQVAGSMLEMEKTMTELEFATGMPALEAEAPAILQPDEGRRMKTTS
jgi:hypothetical protein